MSESIRGDSEQYRLTISHQEAISNPDLRPQYQAERVAAIKAGGAVWVIRGFSGLESTMEPGVVYDFYKNGNPIGFIDGDSEVGYDVYQLSEDEGERPVHLNLEEPVPTFEFAQKKLENATNDKAA